MADLGAPHVVKLGGSLLELPDLVERLQRFRQGLGERSLLVVGGGRAADTVRHFDRHHGLGETRGHWLAIRAMQFHAHVVAAVLPDAAIAATADQAKRIWSQGQFAIADPLLWLEGDEERGHVVAHQWDFTSDSIAAHVAVGLQAATLTLLKSTAPDGDITRADAAGLGLVDACFPQASASIMRVEVVNLRESAAAPIELLRPREGE